MKSWVEKRECRLREERGAREHTYYTHSTQTVHAGTSSELAQASWQDSTVDSRKGGTASPSFCSSTATMSMPTAVMFKGVLITHTHRQTRSIIKQRTRIRQMWELMNKA
jgi:hypothetical protein